MAGLDFLAVVSRPDFPTGTGPVGDYYGLRRLLAGHPDWRAAVLELNSRPTNIVWEPGSLRIEQEGVEPFVVEDVRVALYLPICLEVEETLLCPVDSEGPWPHFTVEQWRPITAHFEDSVSRCRCLNTPSRVRTANNKLLQFEVLRTAGFTLPTTSVRTGWPTTGVLRNHSTLVAKNVSEGGWKSPDVFNPARLVEAGNAADQELDPWPVIWQPPIDSDRELRAYVMGDNVTVVELRRNPDVIDVRVTNDGKPSARILHEVPDGWRAIFLGMTRALGLDYAVIDAIPTGDRPHELHVLEVNANGVWWFLPAAVGEVLEARFHTWLEGEVDAAVRASGSTAATETHPLPRAAPPAPRTLR